jgi:hypothetical protein
LQDNFTIIQLYNFQKGSRHVVNLLNFQSDSEFNSSHCMLPVLRVNTWA